MSLKENLRVVLIGCTHVGSRIGLWKDYTKHDGSIIYPNELQRKLLLKFSTFWEMAGQYDCVLLLGDLCDGDNPSEGTNLTASEPQDQVECCIELFKPFLKGKIVRVVSGSRYHQGYKSNLDRAVAQGLEREGIDCKYCGTLHPIHFPGPDRIIVMSHGKGMPELPARKFEKEIKEMDGAIGRGALPFKPHAIVHGHGHKAYQLYMHDSRRWVIQIPSWKVFFEYKGGDGWTRYMSELGGYVLELSKKIPTAGINPIPITFPYEFMLDELEEIRINGPE